MLRREQPTTAPSSPSCDGRVEPEPDERLRLIFTCCHPALPRAAQIALTLRVVCGLTTAQIARAFLVPEATVAQRITRAKRKISDAGIPYRIPDPDELRRRGSRGARRHLPAAQRGLPVHRGDGAVARPGRRGRLARRPAPPAHADRARGGRAPRPHPAPPRPPGARFDPDGGLVLLEDQDRSRWDRDAIADATRLLASAARQQRPGPYQLQAAIVACHAEAEQLGGHRLGADRPPLRHAPAPRAVAGDPPAPGHRPALRRRPGRRPGRARRRSAAPLDRYHLFHATRAELLRALGHPDEARAADQRALALTANPAEQSPPPPAHRLGVTLPHPAESNAARRPGGLLGLGGDADRQIAEWPGAVQVVVVEEGEVEAGADDEGVDGAVEVAAAADLALERGETVLPAGDLRAGGEPVLDEVQGPAGAQYAVHLGQRSLDVGDGAQRPCREGVVDAGIVEGQVAPSSPMYSTGTPLAATLPAASLRPTVAGSTALTRSTASG